MGIATDWLFGAPKTPLQKQQRQEWEQRLFQGLQQFGTNLMQASGGSFQPRDTFSRLGAGFQGFNQAQQDFQKQKMQQLQMQALQQKLQANQAFQQQLASLGQPSPAMPAMTPTEATLDPGYNYNPNVPGGARAGGKQSPLQALWAKATPAQRAMAIALGQAGDRAGALKALAPKDAKGLPTGTMIDPKTGQVVYRPGAKDIVLGQKRAGASNIYNRTILKSQAEYAAKEDRMRRLRARAAATNDPKEKERLLGQATAIERDLTLGKKQYPQYYVQAQTALGTGTTAAANLVEMLSKPDISRVSPADRAAIAQQYQQLILSYATVKQRGANFTDSEQNMISALAGGDPTAWANLPLRSKQDFIKKLRIAHADMVREGKQMRRVFRTGRPKITPLPPAGDSKATSGKIPRIKGDADYKKLPSGAQFIGPDGKLRRKP